MRVRVLRLLGGAFLVLSGFLWYLGIDIGLAASLLLVAAGAALLLALAVIGRGASGGDTALFMIGLLVLGTVAVGPVPLSREQLTFAASRSQVPAQILYLSVSTGAGVVKIIFSNDNSLAYEVTFSRRLPFPAPPLEYSLTNHTSGDSFFLNATSSLSSIAVTLGTGYSTDLNVTTGTGSVSVGPPPDDQIRAIAISTGTGSIDTEIGSASIEGVTIKTGTGSIRLTSGLLAPSGEVVPIDISTGTGSIDANLTFVRAAMVSVTASTSLGTLSHYLRGFNVTEESSRTISAFGGDPSASRSFVVVISASIGSASMTLQVR